MAYHNRTRQSPNANDITIQNSPSDSVSSLSLNGDINTPSNMLIAGCWDKAVYCYQLQYGQDGNITGALPQAQIHHDGPVLCTDIASDGLTVFSGGADNALKMWNPSQGNTAQTIGQHELPIRSVKVLSDLGVVATASWDKTVKLWDTRQPTPVHNIQLTDRAYSMDARGPAMVVGTGDRKLAVFDITQGHNFNKMREYDSPLSYQTRVVKIFHDVAGFAVGSIEGRVAIEYFDKNAAKSFPFRCHRDKNVPSEPLYDLYSVNAISFTHLNTLLTGGSDGVMCYWDKDKKEKLKTFDAFKGQAPITDAIFSPMGNITVYSRCYDWSMGKEKHDPKMGCCIMIHQNTIQEISPKETTPGKK